MKKKTNKKEERRKRKNNHLVSKNEIKMHLMSHPIVRKPHWFSFIIE